MSRDDSDDEFFETGRGEITFTFPDGRVLSGKTGIPKPAEPAEEPEAPFAGFRDPVTGLLEFGLSGATEVFREIGRSSGAWGPRGDTGGDFRGKLARVTLEEISIHLRASKRAVGAEEFRDGLALALAGIFALAGELDLDLAGAAIDLLITKGA